MILLRFHFVPASCERGLYVCEKLFTPIIDQFFLWKRKQIRKNTHPWINGDILLLIRNRDRARKKALKTKLEVDFHIYNRLRNCVTSVMRKAKMDYFQRQLDIWTTVQVIPKLPGKL